MDNQHLSVQESKKRLCNIGIVKCCEKPSSLRSREYGKGIFMRHIQGLYFTLGGIPVRYQAEDEKSAIIEIKSMSSANEGSSATPFGGVRGGGGSVTAPMRRKPKRRPPRHFDDSVLNTST